MSSPISNLSSALSHEIRNPLSSVKMAVQTVVRSQGLSERDKRRLEIANREIRTIERMLTLFSEYGRETPVAPEPTSLRALVAESAALVEAELSPRGIHLRVEGPAGLEKVQADAMRLRPVLAQLLLNVAAGLPDDGELDVQLVRAGRTESLCIVDPNAKLPPGSKELLFEPFGTFPSRGPGLSLPVLQRLMRLHGGEVQIAERSPGLSFTLSFPG